MGTRKETCAWRYVSLTWMLCALLVVHVGYYIDRAPRLAGMFRTQPSVSHRRVYTPSLRMSRASGGIAVYESHFASIPNSPFPLPPSQLVNLYDQTLLRPSRLT